MKIKKESQEIEKFKELSIKSKEIKVQLKKEIYVFNFVIIAICTAIIYILDFEKVFSLLCLQQESIAIGKDSVNEIQQSLLYSFALYTAFDRLKDKWNKTILEAK